MALNSEDTKRRIQALLAKHRGESESKTGGIPYTVTSDVGSNVTVQLPHKQVQTELIYNSKQQESIDNILSGKSCIITGAAGTGKTSTIKGAIAQLLQQDTLGVIPSSTHKWLIPGSPNIVCVSFTNKAVQNIKKALPKDLHSNCITIHKLLEYQPEFYDVFDTETGETKTTMQFLPTRHERNPLPNIDVLIIDEAPMVSIGLWNLVATAIVNGIQVILIGDIHQLPPIFGKSIFIWAMQLGATVTELTHVYRQALESPIIALATRVREGKQISPKDLQDYTKETPRGKVTIKPWKKKLSDMGALKVIQMFLTELIDAGSYSPIDDVILTPYNKSFGTLAMNSAIATHLAKKESDPEKQKVWEIFAGVKKVYLRVGDKVLVHKTEAIITEIDINRAYYGKRPRPPSNTMDYNGIESDAEKTMEYMSKASFGGMDTLDDVDHMLNHLNSHVDEDKSISREASHKVTVYIQDLDTYETITTSGDINNMDLAYAITVHKSQGSEYRRVFFITHGSQANMCFRELLYTAITRAQEELYIICEPNLFLKGIVSQRILGTTLEEKIANFDRALKISKQGEIEIPVKPHLLLDNKEV